MKRNHSGSFTSLLFKHTLLIIVASLSVRTLSAQELNPDQLATTVSDGFTIAVVGDIIISYSLDHMMGDAGFRAVVELIQGADVSTGNLEGNIIDGRKFRGSAGGGFGGEPEVAEWVKTMGFDIVSRPNNHADDFGREGLIETSSHLDRAGLQYAGYGDSYWAAKAARYYSSPRGRVGMVAVSDHQPRAQLARGEWPGIGGLSPLRVTRYFMVPEDSWEALQTMRDHFPNGTGFYARGANSSEQIAFIGNQFRKAARGITEAYYHYEINQRDLRDTLAAIREGKIKSDFITVAIHAHHFLETTGGYRGEGIPDAEHIDTNPSIADYLPVFAKAAIDNGADLFQGTGVHALRGIEIYNNRPIFYGLGEFIRQMDVIGLSGRGDPRRSMGPPDAEFPVKFESIIAISEYAGGELKEVRIHPVEARYAETKLAQRGIPRIAPPAIAQRILRRLQALSAPLGTEIQIVGNIGIIRP
ncbi:MAG: CapA family protein [Proteobacteria bacterium]|nr:CapA family protein [Pseudomonadota bacterium]MCH8173952.1 CapA family protein [Pseudomonadota bacterium]